MKGIAIIAMLCHHLWYCAPQWAAPHPIVLEWIGDIGKICVALFLFCSGYGLSKGYHKVVNNAECTMHNWKSGLVETLKFQAKRLVKFYTEYWPIFVVFVPISVFVFGRPLSAAYGDHVNVIKHLGFDLLGVKGYASYNMTWWFNKLILIYYLLFPLLFVLCKQFSRIILIASFIVMFFDGINVDYMSEVLCYGFPFVLGIVWCLNEQSLSILLSEKCSHRKLLLTSIFLFVLLIGIRFGLDNLNLQYINSGRVDGLLTCAIGLVIVTTRSYMHGMNRFLAFVGKHAANIYLMHSFFTFYWPISHWLHGSRMTGGG